MPGPTMKLAGALFAGTLAGVAALTTLTSSSASQLSPASDSTPVTQSVVASSAPCPAGTVEREDSCVKTVAVPVTAPRADDDATETSEATEAPKPNDVSRPAPAAHTAEPAESPETEATSEDGQHESDANEVEHDGEHADSDQGEHESND